MSNNHDNKFEKLEELNAQIDVWIDDEDYISVFDHNTGIKPNNDRLSNHDQTAESYINACFPEVNNNQEEQEKYCTHGKDDKWQQALSCDIDSLPVIKVGGEGLKPPDKYWSHLFYAKLLRAKIKQKGSDCYTRRLDDVAAYLERHLPQQNTQDEGVTRLTLMYLLELSAVSLDWESLGFAERARRVITDEKYSLEKADEKAPYEFYELWARFNIGVAYFHQAYYRKAVLEFNQIIWQVERWKKKETSESESRENLVTFRNNHGVELLYSQAILFRTEVQLKLQFAYHSLATLKQYFWKNERITIPLKEEGHRQGIIRAMLITVQAYQQLGRLDRSWPFLYGAYSQLSISKERLGKRTECVIPKRDQLNQRFLSLGERFIDILTADHFGWLKLEGEDERINQEDDFELRYIAKNGRTKKGEIATAKDYEEAVNDSILFYLNKLVEIFKNYFSVVEHHAYNRSGYFQQLAIYLGWLAKAADFKCSNPDLAHRQEEDINGAQKKIADIAIGLYEKAEKDGLLLDEDELDKPKSGCRYCDAKGIDLRKLGTDHYTWFTEDMLKFFKSKTVKDVLGVEAIKKDKEDFVERLLKLEQRDREDLRIRDLELRYEYYKPKELLEHSTKRWKMRKGMELCGKVSSLKDEEGFAGLLKCVQGNKWNQENYASTDHLTSDDYIKLIQGWDEYYLRHLQSPSTHENHQKGGFYFMGLQRWNSASPAKGYSVGGGYLLYHLNEKNKKVDMGIAIDPGFDFVRNLFHMGFSLDDIDIVLISHAHLDHIRDFESIIMLLSELKKKVKREKRVHVILSLGAYRRLEHIVEDPGFRYLLEPYIIDVDREIRDDYFEDKEKMPKFRFKPVNGNREHKNSNYMERFRAVFPTEGAPTSGLWAKITPTRAYHDDKTNYSDSFGFLIELRENNQDKLIFGYTGDTKWVYPNMHDPLKREVKHEGRKIEDIAKQYEECDVLLVHLGSLIGKNNNGKLSFAQYDQCSRNENEYRCEELVRENDHPYLIGMLRLLSSYYNCVSKVKHTGKPLVLVSEFGEELRGTIRTDFIRRVRGVYGLEMAFLPVDVGLNVLMGKKYGVRSNSRNNRCACKVWCVQCNHFVNIGDAEFELYGTDHALYCVCKTCRKATPVNVLQDRLRQLYEVGLELRNNDNK